jgi:hypothetical protein
MVGGLANSVSFRHGTNVEFEGPSFVSGVPAVSGAQEPRYNMEINLIFLLWHHFCAVCCFLGLRRGKVLNKSENKIKE